MHKTDKERNKDQKKRDLRELGRTRITHSENPRETSLNKLSVVEQMYHVRVHARCWGYKVGKTQQLCSHEVHSFLRSVDKQHKASQGVWDDIN